MGCFQEILKHKQANKLKRHKFSKGLCELQKKYVASAQGTWVTDKQLFAIFKLEGYRSKRGLERALCMCESGGLIRRTSCSFSRDIYLLYPNLRYNPCRVKDCPYVAARDDVDLVQVTINGGPPKVMDRSHLRRQGSHLRGYTAETASINGLCKRHEIEQEMVTVLCTLKHIKIAEAFKTTDRLLWCLQ